MNFKLIVIIVVLLLGPQAGLAYDIPPGMEPKRELEQFISYGKDLHVNTKIKPQKDVVKKIKNPHDPKQIDEWHTVYYRGLIIRFYRATSAPGDLVNKVILSNKEYTMPFNIQIGDTREKVMQKLGVPTDDKEEKLYYDLPYASYSESVTFKFSKGILKEVEWDFEID